MPTYFFVIMRRHNITAWIIILLYFFLPIFNKVSYAQEVSEEAPQEVLEETPQEVLEETPPQEILEETLQEVSEEAPQEVSEKLYYQGLLKFMDGNYKGSLKFFNDALKISPDDPNLYYHICVSYMKMNEFQIALTPLKNAVRLNSELHQARYELSVLYMKIGREGEAREGFKYIINTIPDTDLAISSKEYLDLIEGKHRKRVLGINVRLGSQYDDNVIAWPSTTALPAEISKRGDMVYLTNAIINGSKKLNGTISSGIIYSFYNTNYSELSQFNLQNHTGLLFVEYRYNPLSFRLQSDYNYAILNKEGYLMSTGISLIPTLTTRDYGATLLTLRYTGKDYIKEPLLKDYNRDAENYSIGIEQNYSYQKGYLIRLEYKYTIENASGRDFSYNSHSLSGGLNHSISNFILDLSGGYEAFYYTNLNSIINFIKSRIDDNVSISLGISRNMGKEILLDLQYRYVSNMSNINLYEYSRNVYALTLKWNY